MSGTAPAVSARPAVSPVDPRAAAPGAVPPGAVPPGAVTPGGEQPGAVRQTPPQAAAPTDGYDRTMGHVAGSLLTGALFVGAGLAIAFCPFLAPFFVIGGCLAGADFLADLAGFSPVKMATGKSLGGWIASAFTSRPSEPQGQHGVRMRGGPQPRPRAPITTEPLEPPQRRDEPRAPAPAPAVS